MAMDGVEPAGSIKWLEIRRTEAGSVGPTSRWDHPDQAFATLAQQELAMLRSSGDGSSDVAFNQEMGFLNSSFAKERPQLDGLLDDQLWATARAQGKAIAFEVASAAPGEGTDEIIFAHDDQFFYGAIDCHKLAGRAYRQRQEIRKRDPDLSQQDRVQLTIDSGLNFCGTIQLTLDYRGRVSESKLDGKNWNPDWYVAASQDDDTWSVEFAIPMSALSQRAPDQPVHRADALSRGWGVKIDRLADHSKSVWKGVEPSVELTGLQASLKPNPAGFHRLIFDSAPDLATPMSDRHVQPAQYQLELKDKSNRFAVPPKIPNLSGAR